MERRKYRLKGVFGRIKKKKKLIERSIERLREGKKEK